MSRTLVAFFSASGTTKRAAENLADAIGADLYEIRPAIPYTAADLNWQDRRSRSSVEMNDPASRPALAGPEADVSSYDRIFLGFPIWWYTAPHIIRTFLEHADFTGKTIVPFCTSGSNGIGASATDLHGLAPSTSWISGRRFSGTVTASAWATQRESSPPAVRELSSRPEEC